MITKKRISNQNMGTNDEGSGVEQSGLFARIFHTLKLRMVSSNEKTIEHYKTNRIDPNHKHQMYDLYPENETFLYDVNISCHEYQLQWVEQVLLPVLEGILNLRCFFIERDRIAGVPTTHTIVEAVRSSKHTIVCFSPDYIASSWKQYEVFLAHHLDPGGDRRKIIPIIVEDCVLPQKYQTFYSLNWPQGRSSAADKIRRKFFACSLLKALYIDDKEQIHSIQNKYANLDVKTKVMPGFKWDNIDASNNKTNKDVTLPPHALSHEPSC